MGLILLHLEVSLPGSSPWMPAPASATAGEEGRVLQYVDAHDMNAAAWMYDYSSRDETIRTGCYLAVECYQLKEEMWTQQSLGAALITLFSQHNAADLERIIILTRHLIKKLKDIKHHQATAKEEEENEKRRLRNTKEEMKEIQNIRVHIKYEFAALVSSYLR